jgi:cytochrome c553
MQLTAFNKRLLITLLLSMLFSRSLLAADVMAGKEIVMKGNKNGATACVTCHGNDGAGMAASNFPRLAGLNTDYMTKQLRNFTDGTRVNMIMQPIAGALSTEEADNVSAYFTAQQAPHAAPNVNTSAAGTGKKLVESGDWDKTIPACTKCHGPGVHGVGSTFPALAGQHAGYIESQLNAWKQGTRKNDPNHLMKVIADRLSKDQIKSVATYLASMKPAAHSEGKQP